MVSSSWLTVRVLGTVALSGAAELGLAFAVGSQLTGLSELSTARDDPAAAAAALDRVLLGLASGVALVAWTRWCMSLAETLIALASEAAGTRHLAASVKGLRRHHCSPAVLLVLGLSTVGATVPAAATGWDGAPGPRLDGLRLPDLPAARVPAAARPTERAACHPSSVVVAPGDSLWTIAAEQLVTATSAPTVRAVARSWPRWHAINRDVIGPDPDLLLPGQRLEHPLPDTCYRRTAQ